MEKKKKKDLDRYFDTAPIHEMGEDEIEHALNNTWDTLDALYTHPNMKPEKTREYFEYDIESNLERLANACKQSLIYFYPDRARELFEVIDANEAWWSKQTLMQSRICPVPLYEGFEALVEIYSIRDSYKGDYRPEDKKAMLSDFTEMERYLRKFVGLAKEYYSSKKIQNQENEISIMKPDAELGKKRREQYKLFQKKRVQEIQIEKKKWLYEARRFRKKYTNKSTRNIADLVYKSLKPQRTLQTIYKFLLKNNV